MGRRYPGNNIIEHPEAYRNAIRNSIHARANAKRQREWEAAHPHLAAWVNWHEPAMISHDGGVTYVNNPNARHPLGHVPTFIRDAINKWGAPTEKATATFQRIFEERTQRAADRDAQRAREAETAVAWTAGRQVVEGVIISVKETEGFAPRYARVAPTVWKALVKRDDGSRIYLTVPRQIDEAFFADESRGDTGYADWLRGKRVRLTVTVQPKEEEPTFAFGSRPAKASILTA
jgi:hypothetical protein